MARNCHLSVYNAVALFGLEPAYLLPRTDEATGIAKSIDPSAVESALERDPGIKLVVITSPTFEGVISDVSTISRISHRFDVPLLVDEAHGAHFGFSEKFPHSSAKAGADIVVTSLHKTLPALTQCALLHVCGELADAEEIRRLLNVLQTTSPSYVLMASIDFCLRLIASDGERLFGEYGRNLDSFYHVAAALEKLSVFRPSTPGTQFPAPSPPPSGFFAHDPGKIVITTNKTALNGPDIADILRNRYKIELEMSCISYAVAMTSLCDNAEGFALLAKALCEIDRCAAPAAANTPKPEPGFPLPAQATTPGRALELKGKPTAFADAVGLMSLEYVWAYPPGIPIIAPGEIIDENIVSCISRLKEAGIEPKSTKGLLPLITAYSSSG